MKRRKGILGGTFNPPHIGHLIIANEVQHALGLDQILFMPNQQPPHKTSKDVISAEHRLKMTELAIEDHSGFSLETIEMERTGESYTYDTIILLKEREPNTDFYFIIGADMIEYLPHWYKINELSKLVQFVGVKRPYFSTKSDIPIILVDIPEINLSSTLLRSKLKNKETVKYLIRDNVISYIKEHSLYE